MLSLGIDTSCYTTSASIAGPDGILLERKKVLTVPFGTRGLRQSEAVFQHVRNLPDLLDPLLRSIDTKDLVCVSVSERPVDSPDSYMPVFAVGTGYARALSAALGIPICRTTHQCGHIRAAQIGNESLLSLDTFNALHLSGGTTDLLTVTQSDGRITGITGSICSSDLHIGQFVDRIGVALGLPFPAGPHLEKMAVRATGRDLRIPSSVSGYRCSFSGAEACACRWIKRGLPGDEVAFSVYDCMARTIAKVLDGYLSVSDAPFLLAGGVASSGLFRDLLLSRVRHSALYFGDPAFCSDNACGTALIGLERMQAQKDG